MKTRSLLFLALLLVSGKLCAAPKAPDTRFITIQSFEEIDEAIERRGWSKNPIWLVFDIDNTILTPDLQVKDPKKADLALHATDGYYYRQKHKYQEEFAKSKPAQEAKTLAYLKAVAEWNLVISGEVPMRLVDEDFVSWLSQKHAMGYRSMGHTARELALEKATVKSLAQFGIDFSKRAPSQHTVAIPSDAEHPENALFKNGILYVGRGGIAAQNHKGKRFVEFLDFIKKSYDEKNPSHVIFVDDRYEHVAGMVEELTKRNIPCLGFHITKIPAES